MALHLIKDDSASDASTYSKFIHVNQAHFFHHKIEDNFQVIL